MIDLSNERIGLLYLYGNVDSILHQLYQYLCWSQWFGSWTISDYRMFNYAI